METRELDWDEALGSFEEEYTGLMIDILSYAPKDISFMILKKLRPLDLFKVCFVMNKKYRYELCKDKRFLKSYYEIWRDEVFDDIQTFPRINFHVFLYLSFIDFDQDINILLDIHGDELLYRMPHLKKLECSYFLNGDYRELPITDEAVATLKELEELDASYNTNITDKSVSQLTNLRILKARDNEEITDYSIVKLINLEELDATGNRFITNSSVETLPKLRQIIARGKYNKKLTFRPQEKNL